jgi:predicted AlkP superfamily phosphohydrolase/phosphomutase
MWFNSLKKNKRGLNVVVFDGTDRIQHMFFRYLNDDHPANAGKDTERYRDAILELYQRADRLVGRTLEFVDDDTALFVLSDHGFKPFKRGINLNAWFLENGYLATRNGTAGKYFDGVDWTRTKAYSFGLGGAYVNLKGREREGAVSREEYQALKDELVAKLSGLEDPATGQPGILRVYDSARIFQGPYRGDGPDLIIGYNAGYRASWDGAVGAADGPVFADNVKSWSGDHCMDPFVVPGVLFSNRPIKTAHPSIMDLGPTVLDLFGVDRPPYMDGVSLLDEEQCGHRTSPEEAYFPAGVPAAVREALRAQEA